MLVQGWERYDWQTMTGQKEFREKHRVEENLTMNGWIMNSSGRKPLENIEVLASLMPNDKRLSESYSYVTDSSGYFGFDIGPDLYDKARFSIRFFRKMFLGDDRWGRSARIRNENVLMFDRSFQTSYEIRRVGRASYENATAQHDAATKIVSYIDTVKVVSSVFDAWAYEPLIIDMPLLGYELYVDLVKFSVEKVKNYTTCNMLGYFYYKPYEKLKKRQSRNIEENRKKAYYSSNQQFLRSLADDRLAENGYTLSKKEAFEYRRKNIYTELPFDMGEYFVDHGDGKLSVYGLKGQQLRVKYYHRNDGSPINLGPAQ